MLDSRRVRARHVALLILPFALLGILVYADWRKKAPQREQRARLHSEADGILAEFRGRYEARERSTEMEQRYLDLVKGSKRKDASRYEIADAKSALREFIAALDDREFYERVHRKVVNKLRKRQRSQALAESGSAPPPPLTLRDALQELEAKSRTK